MDGILYQIFEHKLFKSVFTYTACNSVKRAIPFFLLPLLTRYLTPSDYGLVVTFQVLLGMAVVVVSLNTQSALTVNYFKLDKQQVKIYLGNIIFIALFGFITMLCAVYVLKSFFSHMVKFPENWLSSIVIIALSQFLFLLVLNFWRVEQKASRYGFFMISESALNVGLSLFFIIVLGWKWQGRVAGLGIASIIFGFTCLFLIYKGNSVKFSLNKSYIRDALFFSIPLIPHTLGWRIIESIDKIFINSMVGVAATGIYSVGYQVGLIIGLLALSFNLAWTPFLFEKLKQDDYSQKVKIVKFTYIYYAGIIMLALILSGIAPFFLKVFVGKNFQDSYKYVFWIALAYAAQGMYFMVVNYIFYVKKTYILAWTTFSAACINIVLNYFLIKINGAVGAAQATAISLFILFIITWTLSARVYKMPWFKLR